MKTLHIAIISFVFITAIVLSSSQAYGIPYVSPPAKYFNSDIVLIGKVISSAPFSPTYTKYQIKVEQYLKNPQSQDTLTVIAQGTNKTGMTTDTVFDVGQQAFLYLKKDQANYTVWWYSYLTDSVCDPAPTATDLNFTYPQGMGLDYNPLQVSASKSSSYLYAENQPVVVKYDAWNNQFTTKTFDVVFQVKNQIGQIVFNDTKQVELNACIGHQIVNSTFIPKISGTYEVDVIFNNSLTGTTVEIPSSAVNAVSEITYASPLQQFKSGVAALDVKCKENFMLVTKASDGSPACVKSDTVNTLIQRGWAQLIPDKSGVTINPDFPSNFQKADNAIENKTIVLNGTTSGPGSISSTTDILFGIGFDKIMHVNQYATGNYNFVLKPGSLGIIGMKYHSLNACNGMWQNNICLTSQQQNISSNYVIRSYPTKADVYTMPPNSTVVGNGSAVGITITEQWKSIDNFTSFVNYTINTTPQANGTYDIMIRDSGPGQFLTIGTIPYNGTFPGVSIY